MITHRLAVVNQKGGTAKTTTSVAVACKLALLEKRVLLIDLDPQANTTMSFDIDPAGLENSIYDVLVHDAPIDAITLATPISHLHLAPGHVELSKTDINLADRERKQFRLKDVLEPVLSRYDYVIMDCPPSFGLLPVNALAASSGVIIPLIPQYFSLEGLKQITASIDEVRVKLNPSLEITGIVFCMVDLRLRLAKPAIEMVRDHYGDKVFRRTISVCSKLNEAHLLGKSIFEYDPASKAAKEYSELAEEILKKTSPQEPTHKLSLEGIKNYFKQNHENS